MSSRRKRAPPVRVDEETKRKLCWNMHEDLKNINDDEFVCEPSTSAEYQPLRNENADEVGSSSVFSRSWLTEPDEETFCVTPLISIPVNLTVDPFCVSDKTWKALIGEFNMIPGPASLFVEDIQDRGFLLKGTNEQLSVCLLDDDNNASSKEHESIPQTICTVECSLGSTMLEDLMWLQKKKIIQLCQLKSENNYLKAGIFLLETGLGKPEFLSEGSGRLKKSNQLIQKLLGHFYDFIIPDIQDEEEEQLDTELERQNIEELYDFVRHTHQNEDIKHREDVQHPALIPVLRPYQCEAVNWMLKRENYKYSPCYDKQLHSLWREIATLCGKRLYYNSYTGCMIREFAVAGPEWPGGILADEMGLGKTVEVLSLILNNTRQGVEQHGLTLPEGRSVNYFVPPPPKDGKKKQNLNESPLKPKEKVVYPTLRIMLLTAIKEMKVGKGASINAIFSYIRATYRYDLQRNRRLIKRTLGKLIGENMVEQVKGRGLAGSFKLGKNYKETKKLRLATKQNSDNQQIKTQISLRRKLNCPLALEEPPQDHLLKHDKQIPNDSKNGVYLRSTMDHDYCNQDSDQSLIENSLQKPDPCVEKEIKVTSAELKSIDSQNTKDLKGFNHEDMTNTSFESVTGLKEDGLEVQDSDQVENFPSRTTTMFPFNTSDFRFECICGELGLIDYKARVQCLNCFLWQHAECVNYKEENLDTTPFYCPHCLVAMTPVPTGATLIISPSSICHQWVDEINRHVRSSSLRVLVYQGVKKHGFIQPHFLAEQDVVITTYDVLRTELNYVDIPHSNSEDGRRFRNQKRYMAIPSPLVAVEWWRVCLDEAQMVECATAKAAEMALRLSAINRWCVTGTPVQRGLEDLYGLILFLGIDPYWVKHWWDQLLYRPYGRGNPQPLYNLIGKLMWRSAKKDVLDQIQIPPQTEEIHWLNFSPVEGHFYHRQHEVCSQDALLTLRKISDWNLKLGSLDRRTVNSILYPLLRLRQACCHPQAVRGEFLPLQKSTLTMEELLKSLQKKCRVECEEAHRQLVCALNGLAGIHIIRGEFHLAAELYREVLRSSEEHKEKLKTDSLQRLHATHNLMELLEAKHPGIPPTLRDDRLKEEAEQLRQHYMTKSNSEVSDAQQALQPVLQTIKELKRKVRSGSPWWLEVIQRAINYAIDDDLVLRIQNELTSNYKQQACKLSMADKFRDCRGLQFLLSTQMDDLIKSQKTVREAVKKLEGPPSQEVIEEATICHLRPVRLPLNSCVFCRADELFTNYESKLFSHTVKGQTAIFEEMIEDEEGLVDDRLPTTSRGLWAASEMERVLKAILSFAKARRMDGTLIDEGNIFMELFESWKKEYKLLHEYWMVLRDHVSAIDELGMATERLRVRHPDEPKPKVLHIIEPHEVEQNKVKLLNDRVVAKSQLQKKLGQLLYLTNLEKSQDKSTGGLNPEPCPICARQLGKQWAVLTCGHCFCNECIAIIVEQYSVGNRRRAIKCAICRQTTSHKEISYVITAETANHGDDIPVRGSHSTKVEAVVRVLKKIQLNSPGSKALVFSTWQGVLDIIAKALHDNNMEFAQINGISKFQENLSSFKYSPKINILLLPLHTGSNGLNIIEATHVLLVEPILNPAHELQAIGRVHRIGQTKPTVVHRFLIKSTIEEKMQTMLKAAERSHSSTSMKHSEASVLTVADLADLFTEDTESIE
ncbi:E3 ubiquitin-protein ligase SHPRH [Polypterus senegalus]|uniref:E3 ubiquitin-protein ligase SHPRH n=1 Tax=Polypterus senegalus TaxID=55291 RepID=UPI0019651420|nr:E3 ubiquitin-protein ligase SHPRH [Polypterus senegalus]